MEFGLHFFRSSNSSPSVQPTQDAKEGVSSPSSPTSLEEMAPSLTVTEHAMLTDEALPVSEAELLRRDDPIGMLMNRVFRYEAPPKPSFDAASM